jgi:hypothetical protein
MKKILSTLTALLLIMLLPISVLAAEQNAAVNIEVKPTQMKVTVPTTMLFVFNEDGSNQYPNNITITNGSSISNIYLSQVDMDGTDHGWKLLKDSYDVKNLSVNEKAVTFKMGLVDDLRTVDPSNDKEATGSATWTQSEFTIPAGETKTLKFEIERGSFTDTIAADTAYDVVMTYEFCKY